MRRRTTLLVSGLVAGLVVSAAGVWTAWRSERFEQWAGWALARWRGVTISYDIGTPGAGGTRLAADLYLPPEADRPAPTVLIRTPYPRGDQRHPRSEAQGFARRGYAVLVQSMRGRFGSEGVFAPYASSVEDGRSTLDWIATQTWSNGRVGTYGCSALGESQLILAKARHPAHRALIAQSAGGGMGWVEGRATYFGVFEGGVPLLSSMAGWFFQSGAKDSAASIRQLEVPPQGRGPGGSLELGTLPSLAILRDQTPYTSDYEWMLQTPLGDPAWDRLGYVRDGDRFTAPALHINSWFDQGVSATLHAARFMAAQADSPAAHEQPVIIGPGMHCTTGRRMGSHRLGELQVDGAQPALFDTYLSWFDRWLKDDGGSRADVGSGLPAIRYYVMREDRWLDAASWPPPAARPMRWFLDSRGQANTRDGDGVLRLAPPDAPAVDRLLYDPGNPVPTRGGTFCCTADAGARQGSVDQRDIELRKDVLVYSSPPLEQALRIVGPVRAGLQVATSATDTDFTARLVDVAPDGRALNIRDSALRLRYRNGITDPTPAVPGEIYPIEIDLGDIAWQVPAGHRLRLQISSSNFPRLERNLNGSGDNASATEVIVARNEVHHGPARPSWIEFPVLGP